MGWEVEEVWEEEGWVGGWAAVMEEEIWAAGRRVGTAVGAVAVVTAAAAWEVEWEVEREETVG